MTEDAEIEPLAGESKLDIIEEIAKVAKQDTVTGRVRVSTKVTQYEEMAGATLRSETADVTRVRIDRIVDDIPQIRTEGDVTIIPIVEEILVLEKRLMLIEEVRIRTTSTTDHVEQSVTLRRQSAIVERLDEEGADRVPAAAS